MIDLRSDTQYIDKFSFPISFREWRNVIKIYGKKKSTSKLSNVLDEEEQQKI